MSESLARFRELKGIGPATEARLHEAGLYTWESFAEVLSVLAMASRGGGTLRELSHDVTARALEAGGDPAPRPPKGERSEAFVVRLALGRGGRPLRSTVTSVRTQAEQPWAGWDPAAAVQFIEEQAGVAAGPARARRLRTGDPGPQREAADPAAEPQTQQAVAKDDSPPPVATPAPTRDHVVILDAGKAIGGAPRELTLAVSTAGMEEEGEFAYRARLSGRALGRGAGWQTLADDRGVGHPPQTLPLRFAAAALPPGVHRLRLELALRLPSPQRRPPPLVLTG
jgi:hypothetical protein